MGFIISSLYRLLFTVMSIVESVFRYKSVNEFPVQCFEERLDVRFLVRAVIHKERVLVHIHGNER